MYGIFSKANCSRRKKRITVQALPGESRIKTWVRYASMRQIHAAIKHLDRGDFECAITLAAAGEEMLPPTDDLHFRKLQGVKRVDDIVSWLRHGEIEHKDNGKNELRESSTINESEVIIVIYRAIAKIRRSLWGSKNASNDQLQNLRGPAPAGRWRLI